MHPIEYISEGKPYPLPSNTSGAIVYAVPANEYVNEDGESNYLLIPKSINLSSQRLMNFSAFISLFLELFHCFI
jgi:hypothetical protein